MISFSAIPGSLHFTVLLEQGQAQAQSYNSVVTPVPSEIFPGTQIYQGNGFPSMSCVYPGQNTASTAERNQNKAYENSNMLLDPGKPHAPTLQNPRPPSPPAYSNTIFNMLKGMEYTLGRKLGDIETYLQGQDKKWEALETQLQSQNSRMISIETQLAQMNVVKESVSNTNSKVIKLGTEVADLKTKIASYEESVTNYSEWYDELMRSRPESDPMTSDLLERIENLEENHAKTENRLIDLQWRSMRENLIFTGIKEPVLAQDEYEDVEYTLKTFLKQNMKIDRYIELDRVHRLGRFDPNKLYPRPIIAKFERYKDKEYVRQLAPDVLTNTQYGVREQFPYEIEEKRKKLYPLAKKARQDKDNKVRMVRDKLFVNDQEVKADKTQETKPTNRTNKNNERKNNDTIRGRVIYAKRRVKFGDSQQQNMSKFEIPTQNKFETLLQSTDDRDNIDTQTIQRRSTKNKASSPLERDATFKKHREGQSDNSDTETESDISSTLGTEIRETNSNRSEMNKSENTETSTIIDMDTAEMTATSVLQHAAEKATDKSNSEPGEQNSANTEHVQTTPKGNSETNASSTPKPGHSATPMRSPGQVQMPNYAAVSNELYYGPPPVLSQPIRSPPPYSTDIPLNTQNHVTLHNSGSMNSHDKQS